MPGPQRSHVGPGAQNIEIQLMYRKKHTFGTIKKTTATYMESENWCEILVRLAKIRGI